MMDQNSQDYANEERGKCQSETDKLKSEPTRTRDKLSQVETENDEHENHIGDRIVETNGLLEETEAQAAEIKRLEKRCHQLRTLVETHEDVKSELQNDIKRLKEAAR